jgi:serine/threonine-protein kinase
VTSHYDLQLGIRAGDVLAGKYRVERVLGHGGMGVVVAAHHVQLDTKVAIKFLLPEMLRNREAVVRFAREARAAARITSEHVARVLDVGVLDTGAPYMVMEFLEGGDLAGWLRQRGPLPLEQAVEFVLQACVAVAEAHGLGIIHRDLKPANMFCVRRSDGQLLIKLLDFGISKSVDVERRSEPSAVSVTKTSALLGSADYMSPEQMQSARFADAQSDIWALGVILYELLCGRVPFAGEAITEVAIKVATQQAPSLRAIRPEVPSGLEAVVFKCLEKDKQRRYRNVAEVAVALFEFAPKRSRGLVERITGTIQAARLSSSALAMPPSPQEPGTAVSTGIGAGTSAPVSSTGSPVQPTPRRSSAVVGVSVGVASLVLVAGAGVLIARTLGHHASRDGTNSADAADTRTTLPPSPAPNPPAIPLPAASTGDTPNPAPRSSVEAGPAQRPAYAAGSGRTCPPACRTGFVCSPSGQCVSACNPPCAAGQRCAGLGICEAETAPIAAAKAGSRGTCTPACRAGFVCSPSGQCVSACNPPCGSGERCTDDGRCVSP